ncbi:MAG: hypothetical protein ACRDJW_24495 [Thermomicrobiales bacterium]
MTSVLNGKITSIRFETETDAATVTADAPEQARTHLFAFGAIEGRIETLRSRHRLSFTLHDSLHNTAVHCAMRSDQAELVRDGWGRRVMVEGWIKREPIAGRPIEIDPVEDITVLPEVVPGSYRRARAIAPAGPDDPTPEAAIRRLRDA